jgi:serine/threonine protein phosphatase PrpC
MSSRLQLKYGVVAEQDRLYSSADAVLVSEPTTGSKARTKGSLYLVVTARGHGGRLRDATNLIADTIRREYYYDESAGIPVVLQKSILSADRKLRHSREGGGLAAGDLGLAVAVVRGAELYVATAGDAEAYLVRAARLLMPEREPGAGLPADDNTRLDVWRGDFSVGDSLLLCAKNLVDIVGTEELKNAVVTLHPQSAVEHLHHLFVAAGGEGSDAVLAIEASEVALSRVEHKLVPVSPSEPLAGAPLRSPIPLADQFVDAANAVTERAVAARSVLREGVAGAVDAVLDLMPRRSTGYRRIHPATSQREAQRRAAMAVLSVIGVVALLGVGLWLWNGPLRGAESPITQISNSEQLFRSASQKADQVLGTSTSQGTLVSDPAGSLRTLQSAWQDLDGAAAAGADVDQVAILRSRITGGLDQLYHTRSAAIHQLYAMPGGSEALALTQGPDGAAYLISTDRSVVRINTTTGQAATIVQAGQGSAVGMGAPYLLGTGGPDLLIIDTRGGLWRWRPSDAVGNGTLGSIHVGGDTNWGHDVPDIGTFIINADRGLYRLYVAYPPQSQILRYEPVADGSQFIAPTPYFLGESEPVSTFRQLFIDGDIYALTGDNVLRYYNGRRVTSYALADLPDNGDIRPGHDYQHFAGTGLRNEAGDLYVWDATHQRVIVFNKSDGTYLEQFVASDGSPALADVRGMYVTENASGQPPTLIFASADGLYSALLDSTAGSGASPSPTASPLVSAPVSPPPSVPPSTSPEVSPTDRPIRTPRPTQ